MCSPSQINQKFRLKSQFSGKVRAIHNIFTVFWQSKKVAEIIKLAENWANKFSIYDLMFRIVYILSHIIWSFYIWDSWSLAAFIAMTVFNSSLSLFMYKESKYALMTMLWILMSGLIWVLLCLQELCDDKINFHRSRNRNRRIRHLDRENDQVSHYDIK